MRCIKSKFVEVGKPIKQTKRDHRRSVISPKIMLGLYLTGIGLSLEQSSGELLQEVFAKDLNNRQRAWLFFVF